MKLWELISIYATPEFETLELQDSKYHTFYKCYEMDEVKNDRPDLLNYDIFSFIVYPGGMENNSVRFIVRLDM